MEFLTEFRKTLLIVKFGFILQLFDLMFHLCARCPGTLVEKPPGVLLSICIDLQSHFFRNSAPRIPEKA